MIEVTRFPSAPELFTFLNDHISRLTATLADQSRHLDELRARMEKMKSTQEMLLQMFPAREEKHTDGSAGRQTEIDGLKILINAPPEQEAEFFEQAVSYLHQRLKAFQKIKKTLEPLASLPQAREGRFSTTLVTDQGLPVKLVINFDKSA